jgi:putative spermidine/putrescine transport system permease protein
MQPQYGRRPWTFYVLALLFTLFVIFLYGPMISIFVLSFQGPTGGLVFPLKDPGFHWFVALFGQARTGDVGGAFSRTLPLAFGVMTITVIVSALASLIMPGLVLSIGIVVAFQFLGLPTRWYSSGLGAHLSWTLPFGLLIMFAVLSRLDPAYEEAARDLGASPWQTLTQVIVPIVLPGMIAVALFGFTLSYDEFPRSWLTVGPRNTLPIEIYTMTTTVTSPALYALGTVTTAISFAAIGSALGSIALIQRRRRKKIGS